MIAPAILLAAAVVYGPYNADLVEVIDGDTLVVDMMLAPGLTQRTSVRLLGVNTPETHSGEPCEKAAGAAATDYTRSLLRDVRSLVVSDVRPDKYAGRVLGRIQANGADLGAQILAGGHGRPYHGEHRSPWCQ